MRKFRVVTKSGINIDVVAKVMVDDPEISENIFFYHDDGQNQLSASVKREELGGLIFLPEKSSANPRHH